MHHAVRTVCCAWLSMLLPGIAAAQCAQALDAHIRARDPQLIEALATGLRVSPTLRRLADTIAASDVIVYVVFERSPHAGIAAHVSFITAAGGRRYLHLAVDPSIAGTRVIGMLGHELQHAAEIAAAPSVVDDRTLAAFYSRIGFAGADATLDRRFESEAAIESGDRVTREARTFRDRDRPRN